MYQGKFSNHSGKRSHSDAYEKQQQRLQALEQNRTLETEVKFEKTQVQQALVKQKDSEEFRKAVPAEKKEPLPKSSSKNTISFDGFSDWAVPESQTSFDLNPEEQASRFQNFQPPARESTPFKAAPAPQRKKSRGALIGGIIFYVCLLIGLVVCLLFMHSQRNALSEKLSEYEKKQPNHVAEILFRDIFENPNWSAIYDNAGLQISKFEGKAAYNAYMEEKAGEKKLSYRSVPCDEVGRNQYDVFLEDEKISSFFMKNASEDPEAPNWTYDGIEAFVAPEKTFRIRAMNYHTVKVNGVQLDESFLVEQSGTKAHQDLQTLSDGNANSGICVYEVSGLLVLPEVTIENQLGIEEEVSYHEEEAFFSGPEVEEEIPNEARELSLNAVRTYCEFMIKRNSSNTLSKYFKPNTPTFKAIVASDLTWIQREQGHSTAEETVTDYLKLSDTAFTSHVSLTWQLERKDGSVKKSPVDVSLLFEKENSGKWRCVRMTGIDLAMTYRSVRLRFLQKGDVISSSLVDSDEKTVRCPVIEIPEGKKLAGWVMISTNEKGEEYYQRVLVPDAAGIAPVSEGLLDKPVDLFPVFAKK